jgi:hypothetical protein
MNTLLLSLAVAWFSGAAPTKPSLAPLAAEVGVHARWGERIKDLLDALNARDPRALIALLDPVRAVTWGPDVAEFCTDLPCVEQQAKDTFALPGSLKYGEPKRLYVQASPTLASVGFDVSVESGGGSRPKPTTQRFATTWLLYGKEWKLVHWLYFTPTRQGSARERLRDDELK